LTPGRIRYRVRPVMRAVRSRQWGRRAMAKLTVTSLQQMKRDGKKIMAAVCYDYQLAKILDRAGVDLISAGDSVGYTNFGQLTRYGTTMDEMVIVSRAVARAAQRAVVNADLPFGPVQEGYKEALKAAI